MGRAILEKSVSFRARGTPVIGLRSEPHACFLRGYAGESEATRDRIAGGAVLEKRVSFPPLAAGHIGKKLQFPRTRRSRDRIAERAIRGGGLRNLRPVISRCANFPRMCFLRGDAGACQASRARGIPVIGLQVEPL